MSEKTSYDTCHLFKKHCLDKRRVKAFLDSFEFVEDPNTCLQTMVIDKGDFDKKIEELGL